MIEKSIYYSNEFNEMLDKVVEEDGYVYSVLTSSQPYKETEKDLSNAISDYVFFVASFYEKEGIEIALANGYYKDRFLFVELLLKERV